MPWDSLFRFAFTRAPSPPVPAAQQDAAETGNSSDADQMAPAALRTAHINHENSSAVNASPPPSPTSRTSPTRQSVHSGSSTCVASSPPSHMLGIRLQTPTDGGETIFDYPDDPEAEALLVPVRRRLEVLKRATLQSMPPPGMKAKSHMQVVRERLLPVGDFIVNNFSHLPDFGLMELRFCAVIAQKYWPLSRCSGTDLYIHSMYRNDQYLRSQKEKRIAQETETHGRRGDQAAQEEQKMDLVLLRSAENTEEQEDPFAHNGLPRPSFRRTSANLGASAQEDELPDLIQAYPGPASSSSSLANLPMLPQSPSVEENLNNNFSSVQNHYVQGGSYEDQPLPDSQGWPCQSQFEHADQIRERLEVVAGEPQQMMATSDYRNVVAEGFDAGELAEATRLSLLEAPSPANVEGSGIDRAVREFTQVSGTYASTDNDYGDDEEDPQLARALQKSLKDMAIDPSFEAPPNEDHIYDDAPLAEIYLNSETSPLPRRHKPDYKGQQSEQSVPDLSAFYHEPDVADDSLLDLPPESIQGHEGFDCERKSEDGSDVPMADDQYANPDGATSPSVGYATVSCNDAEDGTASPPKRRRLNPGEQPDQRAG